jgi:hypothetical protein
MVSVLHQGLQQRVALGPVAQAGFGVDVAAAPDSRLNSRPQAWPARPARSKLQYGSSAAATSTKRQGLAHRRPARQLRRRSSRSTSPGATSSAPRTLRGVARMGGPPGGEDAAQAVRHQHHRAVGHRPAPPPPAARPVAAQRAHPVVLLHALVAVQRSHRLCQWPARCFASRAGSGRCGLMQKSCCAFYIAACANGGRSGRFRLIF